jgi:nitrite reductase/ring-hydroxylating ferredoxin subunit
VGAHAIATVAELVPGSRKIVEVEGRSIGVFNVHGSFFALRNTCPHQGAPLCLGTITGLMAPSAPGEYRFQRAGEIVRCPWHGWEFDITTGRSVFNPHRTRVRRYEVTVKRPAEDDPSVETYPLTVEDGIVLVHV